MFTITQGTATVRIKTSPTMLISAYKIDTLRTYTQHISTHATRDVDVYRYSYSMLKINSNYPARKLDFRVGKHN